MSLFPFRRPLATSIKDHLKLLLGALVYPVQSRRWHSFVRANAVLSELSRRFPHMRHKIYRPYLSADLSCADRVDVLMGHYRHLFQAGLGELMAHAALQPVPIVQFAGKSGALFELHLAAVSTGHREGELTLQLVQEGVCVYAATFALVTLHGEPAIALAAMQGLRSDDGAAVIKSVTRELHGCRPKKLLLSVVRAMGSHLGGTRILLVSNQNRITCNGRRARRISSNYDETWEEMGALRGADGNYEMACADAGQDFSLVPSHKRASARRRSALLAEICAGAQCGLELRRRHGMHLVAGVDTPSVTPTSGDIVFADRSLHRLLDIQGKSQ